MARRRYLRPLLFRCGNLCLPLDILMLIPPTGTIPQDARPDTLSGLPAAYPIARRNTGYPYDVRGILAVDLTSICIWQRWTLWLIPEGYIASQKMPDRPNGHG